MNEKRYLKLTEAVYKSIEFLPEDEPLSNKIKEKTLSILGNLILSSLSTYGNPISFFSTKEKTGLQKEQILIQILTDIEILKNYLRIGRSQSWIEPFNFLILAKEYDRIKKETKQQLENLEKESKTQPPKKTTTSPAVKKETLVSFSARQEKILNILKNQGKAQVSDFKKVFPEVSKRTLRRDLDDLRKKGKVVRTGEWNQVSYEFKQG